ncbi:MAG: tetratricopeptide repeat protein [Flavobacteriaceae bacterium]|nr:tetratricopeptide repeat protein [Flavobacteriaceae bacterium]
MKRIFYFLSILFLISCGDSKNSTDFMTSVEGRYLFNSDETIEIYFEESVMKVKWRGKDMKPIKATENSFYLKEMNEKMVFISEPEMHMEFAPKREHEGEKFSFAKLKKGEKTPSEHFKNKGYQKAVEGYLAIQKNDSLDPTIYQWSLNRMGYRYLNNKKHEEAIEIFKINIALYPNASNVYDSMGDAYKRTKDTVNAIEYYKKCLEINPENRGSKRNLKRLSKE